MRLRTKWKSPSGTRSSTISDPSSLAIHSLTTPRLMASSGLLHTLPTPSAQRETLCTNSNAMGTLKTWFSQFTSECKKEKPPTSSSAVTMPKVLRVKMWISYSFWRLELRIHGRLKCRAPTLMEPLFSQVVGLRADMPSWSSHTPTFMFQWTTLS